MLTEANDQIAARSITFLFSHGAVRPQHGRIERIAREMGEADVRCESALPRDDVRWNRDIGCGNNALDGVGCKECGAVRVVVRGNRNGGDTLRDQAGLKYTICRVVKGLLGQGSKRGRRWLW